jgi:hypothetical protein
MGKPRNLDDDNVMKKTAGGQQKRPAQGRPLQ